MGRVDVALEEFKALRSEILAHQQAQAAIVGITLTATAVIGGLAFGDGAAGTRERHQILLVLPIVLSGLGLAYLSHSRAAIEVGAYIRDRLWPSLQNATSGDKEGWTPQLHSWEEVATARRAFWKAFLSVGGALSWMPGIFIFGLPGAAALAFNWDISPFDSEPSDSRLELVWCIDAGILALALILLIGVGIAGDEGRKEPSERLAVAVDSPATVMIHVTARFPDGTVEEEKGTIEGR